MHCVTPFGQKKPVAHLNLGILCDIWEDAWTMMDIFLKSCVFDIGSWEDRNITLAGTSILTVKLHPFILAYFLFFYLFFFLGEWIAPLTGRHRNTEALIWCEICSRHAEKSQETRGSYEERDQVVLKRCQSCGVGLLLLCFNYHCRCSDGWQGMKPVCLGL